MGPKKQLSSLLSKMNLIEIDNVSYQYEESRKWAVKNVDLSIKKGEFVSIIGPNGSGKSTLAKLINVLLQPTTGKVTVQGLNTLDPDNIQKIRQQVGMVFQNPDNQLVASMVEDDVAFGLENLGIPTPEIRKRVDQALRMVGMAGYQRYGPHNLSGGQKQRVAIAGIIAMEPECIIFDEPTAMLDPRGRQEVMEIINYLNRKKGITIVYITHFMSEACRANRSFVMLAGQIVKQGKPARIFSDIDYLKNIGLDVPVVMELAVELNKKGIPLNIVLTVDELVKQLC